MSMETISPSVWRRLLDAFSSRTAPSATGIQPSSPAQPFPIFWPFLLCSILFLAFSLFPGSSGGPIWTVVLHSICACGFGLQLILNRLSALRKLSGCALTIFVLTGTYANVMTEPLMTPR